MASDRFMEKLRSFFGLPAGVEPPRNDFRNPIWGSDDDDDGDDLYTRQQFDATHHHLDVHQEITKHVHDMIQTFGGMFGDVKSFFHDDLKSFFSEEPFDDLTGVIPALPGTEPDNFNSCTIRDYYLKPGYHNKALDEPRDRDLDGKISSQEIFGLLKNKDEGHKPGVIVPFSGSLVPGNSFCKTIITTSVKKPDGSIETRRIVKTGNEIIEETTTSTAPTDPRAPTPQIPDRKPKS